MILCEFPVMLQAAGPCVTDDSLQLNTSQHLWNCAAGVCAQPPDLLPAVLLYLWSVSGQRLVRNR